MDYLSISDVAQTAKRHRAPYNEQRQAKHFSETTRPPIRGNKNANQKKQKRS
jgi:hypothetical protein